MAKTFGGRKIPMDSRDPIGRISSMGPTDNAYRPPLFGPMETPLLEQRFRLVNWADCYSDSVGASWPMSFKSG